LIQDYDLLLVAHGSARYPEADRAVRMHAAALQAEGRFANVGVGLLNGEPAAADALAKLHAPEVHVVPFFMEAGWFSNTAVPRALGLEGSVTKRNGQVLRYAAPIGTHAGMAMLIEQRVNRVAPSAAALLVVGHGSARTPGRAMALHRHVARMAAGGRFERVQVGFLEEAPFAGELMAQLRGVPAAVVGFFAGEGGHVRDDLPNLIAAERGHRGGDEASLIDCGIIADEPGIRGIILDQVAASR
jgi:sirohydrochlorin cobaltochelatase